MQSLLSSNKNIITVLGIAFSLIIVATAAVAVSFGDNPLFADGNVSSSMSQSDPESDHVVLPQEPSGDSAETDPGSNQGETPAPDTTPVVFNKPDEMKAVYLVPGVDYMATSDQSEAKGKAEIDSAINKIAEMSMNTVILHTAGEKGVAYVTERLPMLSQTFDPLDYAIKAAKAKGLYVYCVYDALMVFDGEKLSSAPYIDAKVIDFVRTGVSDFVARYQPDGLILDDYYNRTAGDSYTNYLKYGGGIGYENYMKSLSRIIVSSVGEILDEKARGMQLGLLTDPVWANKAENERGSATSAAFSMLRDGNADVVSFVEDKLVDFVMVKAYGSIADSTIPFSTVVKWWAKLAADNKLPLFVVHAADKICTQNPGWTSPDQITLQVIEARGIDGYCGSVFNSLSRLVANPSDATTKLLKYYKGEINPEYMLRELTMSKPEKTTFTTYEPTVTFMGASDPDNKLTLNGESVTRDENGFFTLSKELKAGLNTFTFVHKEKTIVYKITRNVQILQSVSPTGSITVDGGMKITVSANAYVGSSVLATLNGKTIILSESKEEDDETDKNSSYTKFVGTFTAPVATGSVQNLGNIVFNATYQGMKADPKTGASVKVNKKAVIGSGSPVKVSASQAETFPTNTLDDISSPNCFPLPKGALDYTLGDEIVYRDGNYTYSYYMLESGQRVYSKDVSDTSAKAEDNEIKGLTVTSTSQYTDVILNMTQPVSFNASYSSSGMSFAMNFTKTVPKDLKLTKNPLFSSANWSGTTLTLKFKETGGMVGYRAYYEGNNLVIRFNNVPSSLANARIVVDPGHGGTDPGALGFNKYYPENVITAAIGKKLANVLQSSYGATVKLIDTTGSSKVDLDNRISQAEAFSPQLFISVHCNSALSPSAKGSETYYFYSFSKPLAQTTNTGLYNAMGTGNRGAKYGLYRVTRTSRYASTLVECGFMSNETDYNKLLSADVQNSIAKRLAASIDSYFDSIYSGSFTPGTESVGTSAVVPVTGVTLDKTTLALAVGAKQQLTATVAPEGATNKNITWSTSDAKVATVSASGEVTAVGAGTATITATTEDGSKKATCAVTVTAANVPVTGVTLNKTQLSLAMGSSETLTATLQPENATNKTVKWSTSDSKIATVDDNGKVTGVAAGTATITVTTTDGSKTATCKVTVTASNVPVTGVTLNKTQLTLSSGATETLTASLQPENATNKNVSWSSGNTDVATVDANGKVTAKAAGSATITVKTADGGKTATCKVTVNASSVAVTGVSVSPESLSLKVGDTSALKAVVSPAEATNQKVTWSSNNAAVASVDDTGKVTAKSAGNAVITATTADGGKTAACAISVTEANVAVSGVSVTPKSVDLNVGESAPLTAAVSPSNATNKNVSWSSGNTDVATVDTNGKVTAKSAGTATITVTTADGSKTANCTITVAEAKPPAAESVTVSDKTLTLTVGKTQKLSATVAPPQADQTVRWESSAPEIIQVDSSGKVTALAEGSATITVMTKDGKTDTCEISVVPVESSASQSASHESSLAMMMLSSNFTVFNKLTSNN